MRFSAARLQLRSHHDKINLQYWITNCVQVEGELIDLNGTIKSQIPVVFRQRI